MCIRRSTNSLDGSKKGRFQLYPDGGSLPKLSLDYHEDTVTALQFAKVNKYFLVSGGMDKNIIIWRIIEEGFTSERVRLIKGHSDVTDLAIMPNDEFILSACVDNNIYIWRSNFVEKSFELVSCVNLHTNYVTSLVLDPSLDKLNPQDLSNFIITNGFKFASYADDGKLVLAEIFPVTNSFRTNVIKDFKEFVNVKNKINSIQKKIEYVICVFY
jgi:WD40 repeat protein